MILNGPPTKILIADKLWDIPDAVIRKEVILKYLNLCYPGYTPVEIDRPFVLCRDDREPLG